MNVTLGASIGNASAGISLNDLLFVQPGLPEFLDAPATSPAAEVKVLGSQRSLRLPSPWFLRQPQSLLARLGSAWPACCGLLQQYGVSTFCNVDALEKVSAAHLPIRFARRHTTQPILASEMRSADAIELEFFSPQAGRWSWPVELNAIDGLGSMVEVMRMAVGSHTPVGIGLPLGLPSHDLQQVLASRPDFITFDGSHTINPPHPAILLDSLRRVRELKSACAAEDTAVLVVATWHDPLDTIKLLSLGATAVSVDALLTDWLSKMRKGEAEFVGSGMLSGIALPSKGIIDLTPIEQGLAGLHRGLLQGLTSLRVTKPRQLGPEHLIGITPSIASLAGVATLVE